jgi:hypothetical protein
MNFSPAISPSTGLTESLGAQASSPASAVPSSFLKLNDRLQQCCPRQLGYFGQDRFVMFYFEPRGDEVMWTDSRSCGFGTGAWQVFLDQIEPLARRHGMNLGSTNLKGQHALLIDRLSSEAYFAPQQEGRRFLATQYRALSA